METINYIVSKIDGDYAYLSKIDNPEDEDRCVARALLPEEIMEGSRLVYEMFSYTMID